MSKPFTPGVKEKRKKLGPPRVLKGPKYAGSCWVKFVFCSNELFWSRNGARCITTITFSFDILVIHSMSCNTIYHTPGGDAPRSAGMWWGPLDIIPQISIFRALYDPKKRANSPGYHFKAKRLC